MIKFTSLTIRNFLSYGNNTTVFPLDRSGTTLIVGEDLDNTVDGKGANGVGKSAIINALTYAVYDKPVSNITKDNLINNINKKNMEVVVEFETTDGTKYVVKRFRKGKGGSGSNTVYLYVNGEDKTPDSIDSTNKEIERIIGIPYELFVRIVVFTASHTPFLDLKQADQTSFVEELFGLTMLTEKAISLKEMIKDTERRIEVQKARISAQENEIARHKQQLASAKQRILTWEQQKETSIKTLKEKLQVADSVDIDQQHKYLDVVQELTAEQQLITKEKQDLQSQQQKIASEKRDIDRQISQLKNELQTNQHELVHLRDEKCPRCKQSFSSGKDEIQAIEAKNVTLQQTIDTLSQETTRIAKQAESFDEKIVSISNDWNTVAKTIATYRQKITVSSLKELMDLNNQRAALNSKIEELEASVNPYFEPLEELERMEIEKPDYDDINSATTLLDHQQFLLKLLTKKDSFVRKALLNKNIPYLNTRLQHYLSVLGLPHKVEFTHEMNAKISQFGRELDFGNLSAGQRARVNFALSLAFKDVLQSLHTKINVCIFDEVLDVGLDTVGVQAAARLLKRKARDEHLAIYIISHRDEIDRAFDKIVTVQLNKGFSYIVESE